MIHHNGDPELIVYDRQSNRHSWQLYLSRPLSMEADVIAWAKKTVGCDDSNFPMKLRPTYQIGFLRQTGPNQPVEEKLPSSTKMTAIFKRGGQDE